MVRTHEPGFGGKAASLGDYEVVMKCGAGTYGSVYRAIHKGTRRVVALKKVAKFPMEDGFPVECKYLEQLCSSRNIVNMLEYFFTQGELVLVFEYMETDLWKIISGPNANVPLLQMKCIMKQLFEGLNQCHNAGIMHRDVKPSNLLFNANGVLKLADFGLTTSFVKPPYLSSNVVSLYYRPPELLMGSHNYGPEIDIWSAGCILVELLTNDYLFAGSNETDQLDMIFKVFGTPNEHIWPGVTNLPGWGLVESGKQHPSRDLQENYRNLDSNALDLASRLLQLDPKKRISSFEALNHPWFSASPLPCLPSHLPTLWKDKKGQATAKSRTSTVPVANPPNNDNYNTDLSQNQFYLIQNQFQPQNQYPSQQYPDQMQYDNNSYTNNFGFDNHNNYNFENNLYQNYYNMNNAFNFAMQFNYNFYNANNCYQPNNFNQSSAEYYNYYINQNNFFNNYSDQFAYYNNYYNAYANLNTSNIYPGTNSNFNNNNGNNNNNNISNNSNYNNNNNKTNTNNFKAGYINNCSKAYSQYDGGPGYGKVGPSRKGIPLSAVR